MKSIRLIWVWAIRATLTIRYDADFKFQAITPFNELLDVVWNAGVFTIIFNKVEVGCNIDSWLYGTVE